MIEVNLVIDSLLLHEHTAFHDLTRADALSVHVEQGAGAGDAIEVHGAAFKRSLIQTGFNARDPGSRFHSFLGQRLLHHKANHSLKGPAASSTRGLCPMTCAARVTGS